MRVFGRVLVLAGLIWAFGPATAGASPILTGPDRQNCDGIAAAASLGHCSLFDIDSAAEAPLAGSFGGFEDVALFRFSVAGPSTFSASITNGFDGFLGLFDGDTLTFDSVMFDDPVEGRVKAQGIDLGSLNPIPLGGAEPRVYILALIMGFNTFSGSDSTLGADSLLSGFAADDPLSGLQGLCDDSQMNCSFALTVSAPPDGQPQPVPEPGTLVLLGTGMLAAIGRARTKKRV